MKIDETTIVQAKDLARLLGISDRRLRQLGQEGTITRQGDGKYLLFEGVQSYLAILRKETGEGADLDRQKTSADIRLKKAKAEIEELELAELKGEMHRSEDVAAMTEDLIYAIRSSLLALPGRVAMNLVDIHTAAEASSIVQDEVYNIMRELAQYKYDPKKYEERVRERMDWNELEDEEIGL